jgi:hypothetical protein
LTDFLAQQARMRRVAVLTLAPIAGALFAASPSIAQTTEFRIDNVSSARKVDATRLTPGAIEFSDRTGAGTGSESALMLFDEWASRQPIEKKFLALFPNYVEPLVTDDKASEPAQKLEKLYMYVAQARFVLAKAPGAIDLSRYATLAFMQKIDPAIKHSLIGAAEVTTFEGKIPIGITLVNKLRDSKKVADHIDFQSELAARPPADLDQSGLQELTALNTPVAGVLEQNIFYVNQIMKFGKFFAVFQAHPSDADKTVVTAFMALAIKASVLDEKRDFEKVPVLRNLVPAQVLMGQSSFNSGDSISAGLPKYARNEIKTVAGLLQAN